MIVIHEAGHFIFAAASGVKIREMRFGVFGFRLVCCDAETTYFRYLLLYAGGAALNLLTAFIPGTGESFRLYSLGAAAFNLLPLYGCDGCGILRCLILCISRSDLALLYADRAVRVCSDITLAVLWFFSVYMNLTGGGSLPLLLIMVFFIICRCKT